MRSKVYRFENPIWAVALALACVVTLAWTGIARADREIRIESYRDIEAFYEEYGYTQESWKQGRRTVPRILLTNIPSTWRETAQNDITVAIKKRIFFRTIGPIVLRANELIREDRERLLKISDAPQLMSADDRAFLVTLARRYGVIGPTAEHADIGSAEMAELIKRVDIIPASLALAQAANESGWGTSRFASEGNALFGQWSWGKGLKPEDQRSNLGDYRIAVFETPLASVSGYMLNLNTNAAYDGLRALRARINAAGGDATGALLVKELGAYSERGEAYIEELQAIMRANGLADADQAFLDGAEPIYLVPKGGN